MSREMHLFRRAAKRNLLALLLLLLLTSPVMAQRGRGRDPERPRVEFGQGTHAFRAVLNQVGLKPLTDAAALSADPSDKVLIVLGRTDVLDQGDLADGGLRDFVRRGGAVLIATDRPTANQRWPREFSTLVTGQVVHANPSLAGYRGSIAECPIIESGRGPLFQGIQTGIATNLPSYLLPISRLPLLAEFPGLPAAGVVRDNSGRIWGAPAGMRALGFAVGGDVENGRIAVLADHSVFINDMMLQADNDNIAFAFNCARWLSDGKRTQALLLEDGTPAGDFNVSLDFAPPGLPPVEVLVPLMNRVLVELERENFFNRTLLQAVQHKPLLRGLLLVGTLLAVLLGVYRFLNAKFHTDLRPPPAPPKTAAAPPLEQRHRAALAAGNLAEAARELAHQTFAALGAAPAPGAPPPAVAAAGSWWQRRRWRRQVGRLWEVAADGAGWTTPAGLERLARELRALHAAAAAGTVEIVVAKNV